MEHLAKHGDHSFSVTGSEILFLTSGKYDHIRKESRSHYIVLGIVFLLFGGVSFCFMTTKTQINGNMSVLQGCTQSDACFWNCRSGAYGYLSRIVSAPTDTVWDPYLMGIPAGGIGKCGYI
jgi:hypothetical protein